MVALAVREVLLAGLQTYDLMTALKGSAKLLAAGIAASGASVGRLVASLAVVADDSGVVDYTETRQHRSLLCQRVE